MRFSVEKMAIGHFVPYVVLDYNKKNTKYGTKYSSSIGTRHKGLMPGANRCFLDQSMIHLKTKKLIIKNPFCTPQNSLISPEAVCLVSLSSEVRNVSSY